MKVKPGNKFFMFGCMYIFLVTGAIVLMTSSILTYLMEHYSLRYDQGGLLLSFLAAGSVLSNYLSGPISNKIGRKLTMTLSAVFYLVGYAGLTLLPPLWALQALLFLTGLGWGAFNNLVNFLVALVSGGSSGKILLTHSSYSFGAFLAPLLVGLFLSFGLSWQLPTGILAVMSFLLIGVILLMPIPEIHQNKAHQKRPANLKFLKNWKFYLYMSLLFVYVGTETGFNSFLVSYLKDARGYLDTDAQFLLSAFWVCFIIGRLAVAVLSKKLNKQTFLLMEGLFALIGAIVLIGTGIPIILSVSVVVIGLALASFYGMVLANASGLLIESSVVSGLMMSLGGLGATIVPYLIGVFSNTGGILAGMTFLAGVTALLFVLGLVNILFARPEKEPGNL